MRSYVTGDGIGTKEHDFSNQGGWIVKKKDVLYIYIVVTDPFPVTGKVELNRDLLHKIVVILNIHWVLGSGLHTQVIQFSYVTHYTP